MSKKMFKTILKELEKKYGYIKVKQILPDIEYSSLEAIPEWCLNSRVIDIIENSISNNMMIETENECYIITTKISNDTITFGEMIEVLKNNDQLIMESIRCNTLGSVYFKFKDIPKCFLNKKIVLEEYDEKLGRSKIILESNSKRTVLMTIQFN